VKPKQHTIRRKLMMAIMGTSVSVLVITCAVFIIYEIVTLRQSMVRGLATRAEILAANAGAALAFQNEKDATEILAALQKDPRMRAGCIYDAHGRVFATYPAGVSAEFFPQSPLSNGNYFAENSLNFFAPVIEDNRWLGTVYLKSDLSALTERYRIYAIVVIAVITSAILLAFVLSIWLQKRIAEPILNLASTARDVSERRDYSLRTATTSNDEIGLLTDLFNTMLAEIQQRDASLRESEARIRAILESAPDAVITIDHQGNILEFNAAAEEMFGYFANDAVGQELAELIMPARFREQHRRGLAHFLQTGEGPILGRRIELTALRADGSEFPVELAITRVGTQTPPMFTGFARDITGRKRAETAAALLANIVSNSEDSIYSKDHNGVVTSWNLGAERMFGYTADEMIGRPVHILSDDPQEEPRILAAISRGQVLRHHEVQRLRKDGQRIDVGLTITPLRDGDGRIVGYSTIARDITERKRAEQEIRQLNAELEHRVIERTAQLEASNKDLESFSYSVSHDLRAPLRAIDGFSKALLEEVGEKLDETSRDALDRVRAATKQMALLIDEMLKLSSMGLAPMRREKVDLSRIAIEIANQLRKDEPDRNVSFAIAERLLVRADPHLMRLVLENLIRNAWKFTARHPSGFIEVGSLETDGERAFFVRDDGAGFDMAHANLLFKPFQRLHRKTDFEGTGIGLATVYRVIQRHGGRLWAEGAVERGATFYFTLGKERPHDA
jgi:PAS domain S-box-containing protein